MEKLFKWLLLVYLMAAATARIYFDGLFFIISPATEQPPFWPEIKIIVAFFAILGWLHMVSLNQKEERSGFGY